MKKGNGKTAFVGVSGGVDSSVTAGLLKEAGYTVVGVFIKVWHPDFLPCDWEKERTDAMRVCVKLDIPFQTLDLEEVYKKEVADYMISEYQKGRTPNPDVLCNKQVKFGGFLSYALENGADVIATGHYAQVKEEDGEYVLYRGRDRDKDQSYFLWTLTQAQLKHVQFPVGVFEKSDVRKQAERFNLPTAQKKDSQGICFLGKLDMKEFLSHYIETAEGQVLNTEGEVVGVHDGAQLYTIGQRHGFIITEKTTERKPYYIVKKDIEKNELVVSHTPQTSTYIKEIVSLESVNWISGKVPDLEKEYFARIRHQGKLHEVMLENEGNSVRFKEPQDDLAVGQSLVLYDDEVCLGGGVISS